MSGTGVLIDSMTVLSAAHVFCGQIKKDTIVEVKGTKYKTYIEKGSAQLPASDFKCQFKNETYDVSSILFYPTYLKDKFGDLAIIKLKRPVRGIEIVALYSQDDEFADTATGVGYGTSGPANRIDLIKSYDIKLAGQNIIDSLGGTVIGGKPSLLFADFDSPDEKLNCNRCGSARPLTLEYGVGAGDSGGPLYITRAGKYYVAGIVSGGGVRVDDLIKLGYYCKLDAWTRVSAFKNWIEANR
jgi:secreted trypsin-like serine protease